MIRRQNADADTGAGRAVLYQGYIVIKGAFPRQDSIDWVRSECARQGYDLDDPTTWTKEYLRLDTAHGKMLPDYAPAAWQASCDLMGGADRVKSPPGIYTLALNLRQGADKPYQPPSPAVDGWHIDGWHFRHFLNTPDQGLLGISLMTDVFPEGGGTFLAADSVPIIARYLAAHPEGAVDYLMPVEELVAQCRDFREVTGEAGDFFLLHPFVLHTVSQNRRRLPRAICNVCYELTEPMCFDRADGAYSPVEQAILRGLGVDRYDFRPTAQPYRTPDDGPINPAWR